MLTYVPVNFDAYRRIRRHLHWTLQCLVGFADRDGRCFPSIRKLGEVAGLSKSTAGRHLAELERCGALSRKRRRGGVYIYSIAARFLPLSHGRSGGVPRARTEEYPAKNKSDSVDSPWKQRMQGWRKSRFWLPQWGPKPGEVGCFAPVG